jgi:hypothetical protein
MLQLLTNSAPCRNRTYNLVVKRTTLQGRFAVKTEGAKPETRLRWALKGSRNRVQGVTKGQPRPFVRPMGVLPSMGGAA